MFPKSLYLQSVMNSTGDRLNFPLLPWSRTHSPSLQSPTSSIKLLSQLPIIHPHPEHPLSTARSRLLSLSWVPGSRLHPSDVLPCSRHSSHPDSISFPQPIPNRPHPPSHLSSTHYNRLRHHSPSLLSQNLNGARPYFFFYTVTCIIRLCQEMANSPREEDHVLDFHWVFYIIYDTQWGA